MKSKTTSIIVDRVADGITIATTQNSSTASIVIPANAASALAGLLAGRKADTLLSPDWTTAADRQAARDGEAAKKNA